MFNEEASKSHDCNKNKKLLSYFVQILINFIKLVRLQDNHYMAHLNIKTIKETETNSIIKYLGITITKKKKIKYVIYRIPTISLVTQIITQIIHHNIKR